MKTGGGEFPFSLRRLYHRASVTEEDASNGEFCIKNLAPLGVTAKQAEKDDDLFYGDGVFNSGFSAVKCFDTLLELQRGTAEIKWRRRDIVFA